jgi:hypothetical protein
LKSDWSSDQEDEKNASAFFECGVRYFIQIFKPALREHPGYKKKEGIPG